MAKATYGKITKKAQKEHKKMLDTNIEKGKNVWLKAVKDLEKLGFKVKPTLAPSPLAGLWQGLIKLEPMGVEEYDRMLNPKKWAKIDEERKAKAEKEALKSKQLKETKPSKVVKATLK